ncbi:MAG: alpha/beta hydrolase [Pseudomonadota bacterium]
MATLLCRRWTLILWAAALTALSVGAGKASPVFIEADECRPRGVSAICGAVAVRENRFAAQSRDIQLQVLILKARKSDETEKPPILILTGGPGSDAREAAYGIRFLNDLIETRDLIFVSQRGVAANHELCPDHWKDVRRIFVEALTEKDAAAAEEEALNTCFEPRRSEGLDLEGYTTFQSALDLIEVRQALGVARWSIWGFSYGTALAQELARLDEGAIEAMALDGVVPPNKNWLFGLAEGHRNAWMALAKRCRESASCHEDYGDILELRRKAIATLKERPYPLPDWEDADHPSGSAEYYNVESSLFQILYSPRFQQIIPLMLKSIVDQDQPMMDRMAGLLVPGGGLDYGLFYTVLCSSPRPTPQALQDYVADNKEWLLSPDEFADLYGFCDRIGIPESSVSAAARPITAPTLLLSGALDPITPPSNAFEASASFTNATLITFEGEGHISSWSDCGAEIVETFLEDPSMRPDLACASAPLSLRIAPSDIRLDVPDWLNSMRYVGAWGFLAPSALFPALVVGMGFASAMRRSGSRSATLSRFIASIQFAPTLALMAGLMWAAATADSAWSKYPVLLSIQIGYPPLWFNWPIWLGPAALIAASVMFLLSSVSWLRARDQSTGALGVQTIALAAQLWLALQLFAEGLAPDALQDLTPWFQFLI